MKILITGANGFIGKNLISELKNRGFNELYLCNKNTTKEELKKYTKDCNFVFHLAGANRPSNKEDFMKINSNFTELLLSNLKDNRNKCPILYTSSIQVELDNEYGKSKKTAEDKIIKYSKENDIKIYIYRLPNVFGKWCKPNYNSVIATFCYNIANNIDITIDNIQKELTLVYIDDVINEFINCINNITQNKIFYYITTTYNKTLGEIANLINTFKDSRENLTIPNMNDEFSKKLYSTYLSYIPKEQFLYKPKTDVDDRGSFTELFKSIDRGQVSVNITKPGITKGNHWHHTKNEKFVVVSGKALIQLRNINEKEIVEYHVSDNKIEIIDIPVGYTHNIKNIGNTDLVTIMWCNEIYNKDKPDTYYEIV